MKKYVACRIVDTAHSSSADRERPSSCTDLGTVRRPTLQRVSSPEPAAADSEPLPVFAAVQLLLDRAYEVRTGKTVRVGRALNIAI
jgi:hypothetical protein